ncbi:MAG: type III secretion protein [Desulfovibrio sp.]|nr:type III secretion protein [Desulfovibrio sp.]
MASTINTDIHLLDPNLGISSVQDAQEMPHMPEAQLLPSTNLREAGLEELYSAKTTDKMLEQALCPSVGDGTILQPAVFSTALRESLDVLKNVNHTDVKSFVSGELSPLIENESLLQAYSGLLIGG